MASKREAACRAWCLSRHADGLPTGNRDGAREGYHNGLMRRVREALADEGLIPRQGRGDIVRAGLARIDRAGKEARAARQSARLQRQSDTARKVEVARLKALELADAGLLLSRSDLEAEGVSSRAAQLALAGLRAEGRIDPPVRNKAGHKISDSERATGHRGPGHSGRHPQPEKAGEPSPKRPKESKAEWLARLERQIEAAAEANCGVMADPPRWRESGRKVKPANWREPLKRARFC